MGKEKKRRGNIKQDESNLLNAECFTGRCINFCEQCFVNLGQHGYTVPLNILHPHSGKHWYEWARRQGWPGAPKDPTGQRLGLCTPKSAQMIPVKPKPFFFAPKGELVHASGVKLPAFLRVSSMSDSALSHRGWCDRIRDAWGDRCFFNAAWSSVKRHPDMLREVFHKVVVTVNGGYQSLSAPNPMAKMNVATGAVARALHVPDGTTFGIDAKRDILNSMGDSKEQGGDFFHPMTLSAIRLGDYEDRIKFYRYRALPTIAPPIETDRPVVITRMRFKSVPHLCEFARRYQLGIEVMTASEKTAEDAAVFGVRALQTTKGTHARVWTPKNHPWNRSEHAGYATEFFYAGSFLRCSNEAFDGYEWVCDRAGESCKACGLCATLDGTEPGGVSRAMAEAGYLPEPFSYGYLEPKRGEGDYFFLLVEEGTGLGEDYLANPAVHGQATALEQDEDWLAMAAFEVATYCAQDDYVCEGWSTHENVDILIAYVGWCLVRKCKRQGYDILSGLETIYGWAEQATDGVDIFGDPEMLADIWDDESHWCELFGSSEG